VFSGTVRLLKLFKKHDSIFAKLYRPTLAASEFRESISSFCDFMITKIVDSSSHFSAKSMAHTKTQNKNKKQVNIAPPPIAMNVFSWCSGSPRNSFKLISQFFKIFNFFGLSLEIFSKINLHNDNFLRINFCVWSRNFEFILRYFFRKLNIGPRSNCFHSAFSHRAEKSSPSKKIEEASKKNTTFPSKVARFFLVRIYQNGKTVPNEQKLYQMNKNYTK
jgi:hypothetical protein